MNYELIIQMWFCNFIVNQNHLIMNSRKIISPGAGISLVAVSIYHDCLSARVYRMTKKAHTNTRTLNRLKNAGPAMGRFMSNGASP